MTSDPDDSEVTSVDDFENVLNGLLNTAVRNEIDVRGSWVYKSSDEDTKLEVLIYELE